MNEDVRQTWVAALRSDRFRQGVGKLTHLDENGGPSEHCCLGVLCELAIEAGVPVWVEDHDGTRAYDNIVNYLPDRVRDWAGLHSPNPRVVVGSEPRPLASLNDNGTDFHRIAAYVEESL